MRKEHSHEYYWVLIFAAALGMYLLRVLLIAGEGKEELEMPVGRFLWMSHFSEEGEFLPPSYLEAARDPEFKESLICLGYQEPGADRNAEAGAKAEPDQGDQDSQGARSGARHIQPAVSADRDIQVLVPVCR